MFIRKEVGLKSLWGLFALLAVSVIFQQGMLTSAMAEGMRGTVPDAAHFDSHHPEKDALSRAGVVGGIPDVTYVKAEVWSGADLQAAIDNGGPGVVLLHSGTYYINSTLHMSAGVILRGVNRTNVTLSVKMTSTSKVFAIYFGSSCSFAGLENLTVRYDATTHNPIDRWGLDNGSYYAAAFENNPFGLTNLYVGMVRMSGGNDWVDSVDIRRSGTDPVLINGWHNTIRNCYIDQAFNKGDGGNGYFDLRGYENLVAQNKILRIRHFAVQQGAQYDVVINNTIDVDVNFHNGDAGYNLIEKNNVYKPSWFGWRCFSTGALVYGHKPPGYHNMIFDNNTWDYALNYSPANFWSTTYTWWNYANGNDPSATDWPYPVGATYYSIIHIPAPWCAGHIGGSGQSGFTTEANGVWTVKGAGADVWGAADDFHYVWQPLHGDGEIVIQVQWLQNTDPWAKAGLMVRENLEPNSKEAMVCVTPGNGTSFQYRKWTGGSSSSITPGDGEVTPTWLRLKRQGNTLTGYVKYSNDWVVVGSADISMWSEAYLGFFVSSHQSSTLAQANFSQPEISSVLTLDKTNVLSGESFTVNFGQSSGYVHDWIGVFAEGDTPGSVSPKVWKYLNNSQSCNEIIRQGAVTMSSGSGSGWPLPPGNYYAVMLKDNGYQESSERVPFTVAFDSNPGEPPLPPPGAIVLIDSFHNNGSFELTSGLPDTAKATNWSNVESWTLWDASVGGAATVSNDSGTEVSSDASDGTRIGFLQPGNAVYNLVYTYLISAGDTFTYSFKWRCAGRGPLKGQLAYKDGSTIVPIEGTGFGGAAVRTFWRTWTVPAGNPAIGKQIAFTLSTSGNYPEVDDAMLYSTGADTDHDGIADKWEMACFGTLARDGTGDADGDGTTDLAEFQLGLNPNDPASKFAVTCTHTNPAAGVTLSWPGKAYLSVSIERSTNLASGSWTVIQNVTASKDGTQSFTDPAPPAGGSAYYHIRFNP